MAQSATIDASVPPVYVLQAATATQVFPEKYVHLPEVGTAPLQAANLSVVFETLY